jgi:YebC/PmpR family DNA-binding regulatory protein
MSGHSAWKNIKHKKAAIDAKRGKAWSKCARAIIVAARSGGGDSETNLGLRYAIDEARFHNMPRDTIEKAIKKGTGALAAEHYEAAIYEGYGPAGVAVMLEILTDNRNRTAPEIRTVFEKNGGRLGATGCVAYLFQPRGQITVAKADTDEDKIITLALDAGALDTQDDGEQWLVLTEPARLMAVRDALEAAGLKVQSAQLTRIPATTVTVGGDDARRVVALLEALEDHDDVQKVHANCDIPDEALASLS